MAKKELTKKQKAAKLKRQRDARKKKAMGLQHEMEALKWRKAGLSYHEIGVQIKLSKAGAYKAVMRALKKVNEEVLEVADEVKTLELERLNDLYKISYALALEGDTNAIAKCISIMDRRAKYLGLDAPKSLDVVLDGDINVIIKDE
jgi:hypothetical protein